ncbi:MAG: type II toxin-antitoxin system RelB/DinJ family antitoxin [Firmicutes bacterium]|nr:type II toxin-antitoxin system RelB/DinJ family antitoxin [Bacillota bacterium]
MAQVVINMKDELKAQAEEFLDELGFDFSTIFTVFLKQAIRKGSIPFYISLNNDDDDDYDDEDDLSREELVRRAKEMDKAFAFATPVIIGESND